MTSILIGLLSLVPVALADVSGTQLRSADPVMSGTELTVSLLTVGPGIATWERFGHDAIWIRDASGTVDRLYSYGIFSWRQERFLIRFVQGRMLYRAGAQDPRRKIAEYVGDGRSVMVQELELTPEQRAELLQRLEWNVRPENAYYSYDYYIDNCSTRIRDMLDLVLGGALRGQTSDDPGSSFRYHTLRVVGDLPVLHAALSLALGHPVDRLASAWDEMFLPELLQRHLRGVRVPGPEGERPLVRSERVLHAGTIPPVPDAPPSWRLAYLLVGLAFAALLIGLALRRKRRVGRIAFLVLAVGYLSLVGVLGSVLAGAWAFTDHVMAFPNENLFLVNPLALLLAVALLVAAIWGRWGRLVLGLAAAIAVASLLGFALQLLPALYQVNGDVYALALPANLAVAFGCGAVIRESR